MAVNVFCLQKSCAMHHQRFFSRTSRGRKANGNQLTKRSTPPATVKMELVVSGVLLSLTGDGVRIAC